MGWFDKLWGRRTTKSRVRQLTSGSSPKRDDLSADEQARGVITNSIGMKMVMIPAGEFMMGSPHSDSDAYHNEKPQHRVRVTEPFFLGIYPVTQHEYERVMGVNPSHFSGYPNRPVEEVCWGDAQKFCRELSALPEEKAGGHVYRLPTEAEWEYACRAGSTTRYFFGDSAETLGDYAWWYNNSGGTTHPVGQKKPNAWGLYDMLGNVREWCQDWYVIGKECVLRGGTWGHLSHSDFRCASRVSDSIYGRSKSRGFRVARALTPVPQQTSGSSPKRDGLSADEQARGVITNSIGMKMVMIPAGEFMMGSPDSDSDAHYEEKPQHRVRITRPFYLGIYPVTQEQYERVMGTNPAVVTTFVTSFVPRDPNGPVVSVSWDDAQEFCRKLSALPEEKAGGHVYRLPTEAEWEYACRAGSTTRYFFGDSAETLGDYAWWYKNPQPTLANRPVGQRKPNPWGLYDMHGNVYQWCADWFKPLEYYFRRRNRRRKSSPSDPTGPSSGASRVLRGSSWHSLALANFRCAARQGREPHDRDAYTGFRVARSLTP